MMIGEFLIKFCLQFYHKIFNRSGHRSYNFLQGWPELSIYWLIQC